MRGIPILFLLVAASVLSACSGSGQTATSTPTAVASDTPAPATATGTPTEQPRPTVAPTATVPPTDTPEPTATPAPPTSTVAPAATLPPAPPPPPSGTVLNISAKNLSFSTTSFTAHSGTTVTVHFSNLDNGVPHDVSFPQAQGNTCTGPCNDTYSFTAPAPGTYQFVCSVHSFMTGAFIVTP